MESSDYAESTPLVEVSLAGLENNDDLHIHAMLAACVTDGCFLLSLDREDDALLHDMASKIISATSKFFDLDVPTKMQWEMDGWGDLLIGG